MSDLYAQLLRQKVIKYSNKYSNKRLIALKLFLWNVRYFISTKRNKNCSIYQKKSIPLVKQEIIRNLFSLKTGREWIFNLKTNKKNIAPTCLKIAFIFNGGLGDFLIQSTYVNYFRRYIGDDNVEISIIAFPEDGPALQLFHNLPFVDKILGRNHLLRIRLDSDLVIDMHRFISFEYVDWEAIATVSPRLHSYCLKIQAFNEDNLFIVDNAPLTDGLSTILSTLKEKNRVNQPDILGLLNMSKTPTHCLDIAQEDLGCLQALGLENQRYIVIQRGVNHFDSVKESVRVWPLSYYESLVQLIKQHYPDIPIVQLGFSKENCKLVHGVDIDLRGKTTLGQLKVIIKYALTLIDYEGGYAHLRHYLNGRSIVLFGPTDPLFLGYEHNINIRNNLCPEPCEWVTPSWSKDCVRGFDQPPCMFGTTPEYVFSKFEQFLESQSKYQSEKILDIDKDAFQHLCTSLLSSAGSVAVINQITMCNLSLFNLVDLNVTYFKQTKKLGINEEYSGVYNFFAEDESYDVVIIEVDSNSVDMHFIDIELLRIAKPNAHIFIMDRMEHRYSVMKKMKMIPCKLNKKSV